MFSKGEYVIYGNAGVCEIIDISTLDIHGAPKDKLYYILKPVNQNESKVFTPVDNTKVVIRKLISKEDIEALIGDIPNIQELLVKDEKLREQTYKDCIRSCQCRNLLSLIKTIYYNIKPMATEDAKLELQGKPKNNFLVFINIDTGKVNVIYRLKDSKNFGLVEPEA